MLELPLATRPEASDEADAPAATPVSAVSDELEAPAATVAADENDEVDEPTVTPPFEVLLVPPAATDTFVLLLALVTFPAPLPPPIDVTAPPGIG